MILRLARWRTIHFPTMYASLCSVCERLRHMSAIFAAASASAGEASSMSPGWESPTKKPARAMPGPTFLGPWRRVAVMPRSRSRIASLLDLSREPRWRRIASMSLGRSSREPTAVTLERNARSFSSSSISLRSCRNANSITCLVLFSSSRLPMTAFSKLRIMRTSKVESISALLPLAIAPLLPDSRRSASSAAFRFALSRRCSAIAFLRSAGFSFPSLCVKTKLTALTPSSCLGIRNPSTTSTAGSASASTSGGLFFSHERRLKLLTYSAPASKTAPLPGPNGAYFLGGAQDCSIRSAGGLCFSSTIICAFVFVKGLVKAP
eukprot:scaffold731_cov261-Pinguiococcus_pyrenoidosus.AAC.83